MESGREGRIEERSKRGPYVYALSPKLHELPFRGSSVVKVLTLCPLFHGSIPSINYSNIILPPCPFKAKDGDRLLLWLFPGNFHMSH